HHDTRSGSRENGRPLCSYVQPGRMKKKINMLLLVIPVAAAGILFSSHTLKTGEEINLVIPEGWPKPVYDFKKNPVTLEGFKLGKKLFFDPMLSRDSTVSCSSCHLQYTNYTHVDHALSHGIKGLKGTRNTLSIMNVAWSSAFMWDGGVNNIEVQPLAPITSPVEMDNTLENIVSRLKQSPSYRKKFKTVFGDSTEITGQRVLK